MKTEYAGSSTSYTVGGPAPIVLIHGLFGDSRQWDYWLDKFSQHHVKAINLYGHGDRAESLHRIPLRSFITDTHNQIKSFGSRCYLIGHSAGGLIAKHIAANDPDLTAGLILLASSPSKESGKIPLRRTFVRWWIAKAILTGRQCRPDHKSSLVFGNGTPMEFGVESGLALREILLASHSAHRPICPRMVIAAQDDNIVPLKTQLKIADHMGTNLNMLPGSHMFHCDPASRDAVVTYCQKTIHRWATHRVLQKAA